MLSFLLFAIPIFAQPPQRVIFVNSDPSGSCTNGQALEWNASSGNLWGCNAGTWAKIGGAGGGGSVTSVTIAGTTNQITATGTCTGTMTITCTLSLPSGLVLPGTIDGLTITTTTGTLTIATAKVLTVSNSLTLAGTDGVTITFPSTNATMARTDAAQTFTGIQNFTSSPTIPTPASSDNSTKAASTAYVTTGIANAIAGVNPAIAVQYATTAAGDTSGLTYANGVSGIGATMTGANNAVTTIDGHAFVVGDVGITRLLIKNDTQSPSGAFNGVYLFTALHTVGTGDIFTRAIDYDTPSDINNTGIIPVVSGTANTTTTWVITSNVTTVGTDPLTYTKFSVNPSTLVTSVTGTSPIVSSGGTTPAISCPTCATGSSGALTQIGQVVVSGTSTTTITFSSISGTYNSLLLQATCAVSDAVGSEPLRLQVNSDAGNNYSAQSLFGNNSTASASQIGLATAFTSVSVASCSGSTANANSASAINILIPGYANTNFTKTMISNFTIDAGGNTNLYSIQYFYRWGSTSAITRLDFTESGAGHFIAGTTFTLYGIL